MKKFIASILCVLMVLTSMSFAVVAESIDVKADRAINVYVDTTEVWAVDGKDIVTVMVKIEDYRENVAFDDHLINAEYTLNYDPALFELQAPDKDPDKTGSIYELFYKTGIDGYNSGDVLETYTFKAIPQENEEINNFYLTSPQTYTYAECIPSEIFEASTESKEVTIKLEPYEVRKYLGDEEIFDSADDELPDKSFNYDNEEHKFRVETVPDAEVSYTVKLDGQVIGTDLDEVVIKGEGTYEIEYTVTNKKDGYAPVNGTYTIEIKEPVHFIEVIENYVLADDIGKVLVLVYTSTEGAGYSYGTDVMVDVSESGYDFEGNPYTYVYGFVTDPIDNGYENDFKAYKDLVNHWYDNAYEIPAVGEYDNDINCSGGVEIKDISVVYGVMNAHSSYFANVDNQKYILKADTSGDKKVRGEDASPVVSAVKNK